MIWAFAGASTIAGHCVASAIRAAKPCQLFWAVCGSTDRVETLASSHNVARSGTDPDKTHAKLLDDALYIFSGNEKHHTHAAAADNHVFQEQPLTANSLDDRSISCLSKVADAVRVDNQQSRGAGQQEAVARNFYESVAGNTPLLASVPDSVKSMQVADAAGKAALLGHRQTVNHGEPV